MFGIAGRRVPFAEGYLEIGHGIFDPWNFFLVSDGIKGGGVQVDGGNGQKNQRPALKSVQISTIAPA